MARRKVERGGPLTPQQADKARRSVRRAVLIAFGHTVTIVIVAALAYSRALPILGPVAAVYVLALPFLLRHLERDIERRIVAGPVQNDEAERAFGRR